MYFSIFSDFCVTSHNSGRFERIKVTHPLVICIIEKLASLCRSSPFPHYFLACFNLIAQLPQRSFFFSFSFLIWLHYGRSVRTQSCVYMTQLHFRPLIFRRNYTKRVSCKVTAHTAANRARKRYLVQARTPHRQKLVSLSLQPESVTTTYSALDINMGKHMWN